MVQKTKAPVQKKKFLALVILLCVNVMQEVIFWGFLPFMVYHKEF